MPATWPLALHWRKAPRSLLHLVIRPGARTEQPPPLSLSSQYSFSLKVVTSQVSDKHHSARRGSQVVLQFEVGVGSGQRQPARAGFQFKLRLTGEPASPHHTVEKSSRLSTNCNVYLSKFLKKYFLQITNCICSVKKMPIAKHHKSVKILRRLKLHQSVCQSVFHHVYKPTMKPR